MHHVRPVKGYLIEPPVKGPTAWWEGHHATNPCAIRLSADPRVFLGYRAGGWDDRYMLNDIEVWASHLGLAVLDERGEKVMCRLPLPIVHRELAYKLPQTKAAYDAFKAGPHGKDLCVLHDFRLWEDEGWVYCIYHEGMLDACYDCIARMTVGDFLAKIGRSIALAKEPIAKIKDEWRALWWKDAWQPAGVNGTERVYASTFNKNDIIFIRLADGSLKMIHRPVPDNAILDTRGKPYAPVTADGISAIGSVQGSVRPGYLDNSHIGNNGIPTRAKIGEVEVYFDITHGVQNYRITENVEGGGWDLVYRPYLRLMSYETGEMLYYSDQPVLGDEHPWVAYSRDGAWVKTLSHLRAVLFAGGHVPADAKKTGLDDEFIGYTGVGDTAVAMFRFTLRELLPKQVIADIASRGKKIGITSRPCEQKLDEAVCGWQWSVRNAASGMELEIVRRLGAEVNARPVVRRAGCFDADGLSIAPKAVRRIAGLGWVVIYTGWRWEGEGSKRKTVSGYGVLLLDAENPERVLYRSEKPLEGKTFTQRGWVAPGSACDASVLLAQAEELIPPGVQREVKYLYQYQPLHREMIRWLKDKSEAAKPAASKSKLAPRRPALAKK